MSSTPQGDRGYVSGASASSTPQDEVYYRGEELTNGGGDSSPADTEVADGTGELMSIWPGEPPEDQLALWAGMSHAHRAKASKRLAAISAYEAGGSRNAADHVDPDDLSLPRFYSILSAWRRDRSLLSLVPQARRRAPRAFVPPPGIEAAAAQAVSDQPDSSLEAIAKTLRERFSEQVSLSWTRKLVARARRDFERELAGGATGFASRMIVDSTALPLPLRPVGSDGASDAEADDREGAFEWAVTALVWDAATGYVLGRALDRAPADMALHAAAASDASARLRSMKSDADPQVEPVVVTTIPLDALETLRLLADLSSNGVEVVHSARAPGSELMKAFDGRIGRLDFRPRFAADAFVGRTTRAEALGKAGRIPMTLAEARLIIDHEITAHNAAVITDDVKAAVMPAVAADRLDSVFQRYMTDRVLRSEHGV